MASGDESEPTTFRALLDLGRCLDLTGTSSTKLLWNSKTSQEKKDKESERKKTKKEKKRKQEREEIERKEAREANERQQEREKEERERKEAREANERQQEREKRKKENERNMQQESMRLNLLVWKWKSMLCDRQVLLMKKKPDRRFGLPRRSIFQSLKIDLCLMFQKYLDLFEIVVKQKFNQYEEAVWPLALRLVTAVLGTKLESIVSLGGTYQEIKKEVLLAHRQTADKLWRKLITTTQGSESFRRWCVRASDKLLQFFQLAIPTSTSDDGQSELCGDFTTRPSKSKVPVDIVLEILQKFLIFEGCSKDLKAHFLERKFTQMSFDEFQELGVAFQQAHGRKSTDRVNMPDSADCDHDENHSSSMQAWKVSVHDTVASLKKMPLVKDRHEFVRRKQLCLNCLMPHHLAVDCACPKSVVPFAKDGITISCIFPLEAKLRRNKPPSKKQRLKWSHVWTHLMFCSWRQQWIL